MSGEEERDPHDHEATLQEHHELSAERLVASPPEPEQKSTESDSK